ncbi:MAG: hypothetical protein LAT83_05370 [Kiritimatiellae bacterium]|nr:hypothetical protein [Kiritimatiellia bacterium]
MTDHRVKYLLIGGYAVAYHGYVRTTGDLDVFVECSEENAEKLVDACVAFGLGSTVNPALFLTPGNILRFGLPPMRLEILNEISGVSFEECWDSREVLKVGEMEVPVMSIGKLMQNKEASGRQKDLLDLQMLRDPDTDPTQTKGG